MRKKVVVIGGNSAGMAAASRAKRLSPDLDITVIEASRFISYGICGVPYFVSGLVDRQDELVNFTPETLKKQRGIRARTGVKAHEILPGRRRVVCRDLSSGEKLDFEYDQLVIATGYRPTLPPIQGVDLQNVFTVSLLEHGAQMRRALDSGECQRAAIVGGGYVGLLMADALRSRGIEVYLFEQGRQLLPQIDEDMAELLKVELEKNGIQVHLNTRVAEFRGEKGTLQGICTGSELVPCDLALIDVGSAPNTELAVKSGLAIGQSGAIQADSNGLTSLHNVFAAGNCAETTNLVSGEPAFSLLATSAARQGRVVGENLAGMRSTYPGTLETSVEKVFGLGVGRTGLTYRQALENRFDADVVSIEGFDRAPYYPGGAKMHVKLVFGKPTGRLLGAQIVGSEAACKRIDTLAVALSCQLTLDEISQLDLAYSPPVGTLWDPIQIAANVGLRKL